MENHKTYIDSLIAGFFTGSLSEDGMEALNRWLDEDVSHRKEFSELRSSWIMAGHESGKKSFDARAGWFAVEQSIKPGKVKWLKRFSPLWYAASLLLCFTLGSVAYAIALRQEPVQQTVLTTATTIRVPLGAKSNVTLPDGSLVWLNAGSEITYSPGFGMESRDLQLTGEAFFDVKSDSTKPFNVHTSGITVKALGTRFNVKAYPEDNMIATTLEEGTVDIMIQTASGGKTQSIKLKPKEQLVIQKNVKIQKAATPGHAGHAREKVQEAVLQAASINDVIIRPNVKTELSTSWKDSKWVINDEPLALFAENLERRYNLHIDFISEELKDYNFSGTFENETVEQILTALSLAAPVNYKFNKNNVELSLNQKDKDKFMKILKNRIKT
ncbi:MAG: FecR domain-containing protein [Bacteroidales bacterium]|jgi:ferric-dicitrate binding protein FerR (iron transport regulator)|nr:FecR domain-containing protein [Bacteroidales bacterium]